MFSGVAQWVGIEPDLGTGWRQKVPDRGDLPDKRWFSFSTGAHGYFPPALSLMFKRCCLPTGIYEIRAPAPSLHEWGRHFQPLKLVADVAAAS